MVKIINPKRFVHKKERHFRWNWEISPDQFNGVRYHLIPVDDKGREATIGKVLEQIQKYGAVKRIRSYEGDVKGTKLKFLLESYDTDVSPRMIDFTKLRKPVKRDDQLRERIKPGLSIEGYVSNLYY